MEKAKHIYYGWDTQAEVEFLRHLGLPSMLNPANGRMEAKPWHKNVQRSAATRQTLLARYIATMHLRVNWGDVSKAFVFAMANDMLFEEKMKTHRESVRP